MRRFIQAAIISLGIVGLVLITANAAKAVDASKAAQIDSSVDSALSNLYASVPGSQDIVRRAAGVLVFPDVAKAGFIVGGATGNGALRIGGKSVGYYNTSGLSFGLQAGVEKHSMAFVFMTRDALHNFQNSDGWDAGADASVAVVQVGAGGKLDASQLTKQSRCLSLATKA